MLQAINRWMPAEASVTPPQGGLFVWLRLPEGQSARELLPRTCAEGVAYAPGDDFFAEGSGERFMRLNFAANPVEEIQVGIERLASVVRG